MTVQHEEGSGRGRFFIERDGRRIAEQVYRRTDDHHIVIVHTEVDESLRGRGVARQLLDALVAWARATNTRGSATCSYARGQFERDPLLRDVVG